MGLSSKFAQCTVQWSGLNFRQKSRVLSTGVSMVVPDHYSRLTKTNKKLKIILILPTAVEWPQTLAPVAVAVGLKSSATAVELRLSVQYWVSAK